MANLWVEKLVDGHWLSIQPLVEMPQTERQAYLVATYGKRADQFRIIERKRPSPAQIRATDAAIWRDIGKPSRPQPSAASLILGKLTRDPTPV